MPERRGPSTEALFAELLQAGERTPRLQDFLERHAPDDLLLVALLRLAVPVRFLEYVGTTPPWCQRPRVLGGVVLNPKSPRPLALRLLPSLFWRDLASVAASPRLPTALKGRADALLMEMLPQMRLGERSALAKIATSAVLATLLMDPEANVSRALLINPRLREEDLLVALRQETVPRSLLEKVAASSHWLEHYAVRLALVLQPRTPLAMALAQMSSLLKKDLLGVSRTPGLRPLVQMTAQRLGERGALKP